MVEREVKVPNGFDLAQAEKAITALLKFSQKSKPDSLFMDAPVKVLMEITAFKTPSGVDHFYNIRLPHSPYTELTELDVLLVVPDQADKDPDHVVGEVRDELRNSECADSIRVREVMTLKQFRDEYGPYEAKRALSKNVDAIIADNKIYKMIPAIVGREFFKKKKFPLGIPGRKFKKEDLGKQIWFALHKTVLNLSLKGQISTLVVGHDNLSAGELTNNAKYIVAWLNKSYPGGWRNVKKLALHIGQGNMPPLPIYLSEGNPNDVSKRPCTKGAGPEEIIDDEISTQLGKRMKIFPNGDIRVLKSDNRDELDDIL